MIVAAGLEAKISFTSAMASSMVFTVFALLPGALYVHAGTKCLSYCSARTKDEGVVRYRRKTGRCVVQREQNKEANLQMLWYAMVML